jgi:hypothetical protein
MKNDEQHKYFFYFTCNLLGIMHPNICHCTEKLFGRESSTVSNNIIYKKKIKNQYPLAISSNKTYHVLIY